MIEFGCVLIKIRCCFTVIQKCGTTNVIKIVEIAGLPRASDAIFQYLPNQQPPKGGLSMLPGAKLKAPSPLIIPVHHTRSEHFLQLIIDHLAHEPLTNARQRHRRPGSHENSDRTGKRAVIVYSGGSHDDRLETLQLLDLAQSVLGLAVVGSGIVTYERDVARLSLDEGIREVGESLGELDEWFGDLGEWSGEVVGYFGSVEGVLDLDADFYVLDRVRGPYVEWTIAD